MKYWKFVIQELNITIPINSQNIDFLIQFWKSLITVATQYRLKVLLIFLLKNFSVLKVSSHFY